MVDIDAGQGALGDSIQTAELDDDSVTPAKSGLKIASATATGAASVAVSSLSGNGSRWLAVHFSYENQAGGSVDRNIGIRFNDVSTGSYSGNSIRWVTTNTETSVDAQSASEGQLVNVVNITGGKVRVQGIIWVNIVNARITCHSAWHYNNESNTADYAHGTSQAFLNTSQTDITDIDLLIRGGGDTGDWVIEVFAFDE